MLRFEAQLLHEQNVNLHASPEVEGVVGYLRAGGEETPDEPQYKVQAYMGFLADKGYGNDGILNGDPESLEYQIESHVVKEEDVEPDSWFIDLGHPESAQTATSVLVALAQEGQRASLREWIQQLSEYPQWFRYHAFESLAAKHGRGSLVQYPQLNPEALEGVYRRLLNSGKGDFGDLYSQGLDQVTGLSAEERRQNEGLWIKFPQSSDFDPKYVLSRFLRMSKVWQDKTYRENPPESPLKYADVYVYCAANDDGVHCLPKICISMFNVPGVKKVLSVNGLGSGWSLEPEMAAIAHAKLKELPNTMGYFRRHEDRKKIDDLISRLLEDPATGLGDDDLRFIYQRDYQVDVRLASDMNQIIALRRRIGVDDVWAREHGLIWKEDKPQPPKKSLVRWAGRLLRMRS